MAKCYLFGLFLSALLLSPAQLFAKDGSNPSDTGHFSLDECNAPPPDSFRVTTSGNNFVTLAWHSIWPGATHTIIVLSRDANAGPWIPVDTVFNIPGESCLVSTFPLMASKCGFKIATNCINGEPGNATSFASPPIALILELILAGRTPNNPKIVQPPCTPLNVAQHNWIGFSVTNGDGFNLVTNTFEVVISEDHPVVKRVRVPPLVAGNDNYEYPLNAPNNFINFYGSPPAVFKIFLANPDNSFTDIGAIKILVFQSGANKSITICQENSQPWNTNFIFNVLVASSANGLTPLQNEDRLNLILKSEESIIVQNPIFENLNILLPESLIGTQPLDISLWDTTAKLKYKNLYQDISGNISIPLETLPKGYYFLRIKGSSESHMFKIFKTD